LKQFVISIDDGKGIKMPSAKS